MARYLLDTTQIIDHLRGDSAISNMLIRLGEQGDVICSCCITVAETFSCVKEKEKKKTKEFICSLEYLSVTQDVAMRAGNLRDDFGKIGTTLSTADTIIAATAMTYDAVLITSSRKHFPMKELRLVEIKRH